ncbi:MAG: extracellular solute-binding protein [Bacillota bacterium]|nr:MAG: extracellular solute-binding protein [Bacillota bacterium]
MKNLKISFIVVLGLILLIVGIVQLSANDENYIPKGELDPVQVQESFNVLNDSLTTERYTYLDYLRDHQSQIIYGLGSVDAEFFDVGDAYIDPETSELSLVMDKNDVVRYEVTVPTSGYYQLLLNYQVGNATLNNITVQVKINDQILYNDHITIDLPLLWSDETKEFQTDRYDDQVLPIQKVNDDWNAFYLYNNLYTTVEPLFFYFEAGYNTIDFTNTSSTSVNVGTLTLVSPDAIPSYETYQASNPSTKVSEKIVVDATTYVQKNSSFAHLTSINNPSLSPFHPINKKLNVIDGISWLDSGQEITYEINVPETGNYKIALHYSNEKHDFSVFRSIYLNGEIPFKELKSYEFKETGVQNWKYETLSNDDREPFMFYLTEGTHTLTIRVESEPVEQALRYIQLVIDHLNKFSLDIRKITGREIDRNRTWNFTEYVAETPLYLEAYQMMLKEALTLLAPYGSNGASSTTVSYIQKALFKLEQISKNPDKVPLYLEDLAGGTGSVAQYLGDSLTMVRDQPLYLNETLVMGEDVKLPRANASFFEKFGASFQAFFSSFTSDKYKLTQSDDVVDIWVNRPITYVDMMQKLADQTFTPETGIQVKISVMPDPNKLIMASAANQQPDVALGLASYMPYDLAIRNAVYPLSDFEDYWQVADDFAPGAFIPYILNDKSYAIPETLDFNVIIYRSDIFEALNFDIPDDSWSWYDVIGVLPELQQYGMNFYHPIAGGVAIKWFYQTSGFIYQFGGNLYQEDGTKTAINSSKSIEGLTFLNQLFTNYSLPEQVPSFYNSFRYATLPIGIADFATYLLIKNAAPELAGLWELAPYPKMTVEGIDNRYYIANGTAGVILRSTDQPDDSWEFLKWWMSEDVQANFAFNLQSTYGPTYTWLSGNIRAFEASPFPEKDREIILEQIKWLVDVPRTPGQYMLERSISDVWNTAIYDGTPTGIAVDRYTILIDREIRRKMIEFGFLDQNGEEIKPYTIRNVDWVRQQIEEAKEE